MKEFQVFKLESEKYNYLILLTSTQDFYFIQKEIKNLIKEKNVKILVDLVLRNGFQFNRFFEFKNLNFDKIKMVLPNDVSESIKSISMKYILNNKYLLDESSLTKRTINTIKSIYKQKVDQI